MKRDSLFYRYFEEMPGCFFRLVGRPASDARRFELNAIEFKDTAVRLDGVFQPKHPEADPVYIWEAQYYPSDAVYANLMAKVGRYLEHNDPTQDWVAVAIYPNRVMEQKALRPYRCLLDSDQLVRVFLDELPPAPPDQFEMGILELIAAKPDDAMRKARRLVQRLRESGRSSEFQRQLVTFIETVILYQFPKMSREEIEKMLQVSDVRETRVFQEALQEGEDRVGTRVVLELHARENSVSEIAKVTGFTTARVRAIIKRHAPKSAR